MIELDPGVLPGPLDLTDQIAVSPNGLMLAAVTRSNVLLIWDLPHRTVLARHDRPSGNAAIAWSSDETLFVGRWSGFDEVHALSGEVLSQWDHEDFGFVHLVQSLDDHTTVVVGTQKVAFLEDMVVAQELGPWAGEHSWNDEPRSVDVHPNGDQIAISFDDCSRIVGRDGEELASFEETPVLRFGPEGESLLTISRYGKVSLYDWPELSRQQPLTIKVEDARLIDGRWLGWSHQSAALFEAHGAEVWSARFYDGIRSIAIHGSRFYTASQMQWIGVRELESAELVTILPAGGGNKINAIAFDETGELVIAADFGGRVTVWDFETATARAMIDTSSLQGLDVPMEVATLSSAEQIWVQDGALNVVVQGNRYVWPDVTSSELGATAPADHGFFSAFSEDGHLAIHGDELKALVRTDTGEQLAALPPHDSYQEEIIIGPDERWLLFNDVSGEGTTLRLWDVESAAFSSELNIDQRAEFVAFEPGGSIVGWVSTEWVFDWDSADDDVDQAPNVFFRWEPETGDVVRWLDAPTLGNFYDIRFAAGLTLFADPGPATLLESGRLERLTRADSTRGALHAGSGRIAVAMEHGVVALIDRRAGTEVLVCTTADGSCWSLRDRELDFIPSTWAAR